MTTAPSPVRHNVIPAKFAAEPMQHVISLGGGVQSTALYLMAAHGLIQPTPTAAIFADTQWEPPDVYQNLDWLRQESLVLPHHIPIITVSAGDLYENVWNARRVNGHGPWTDIPAFTINTDGNHGIGTRHCTENYKIGPIVAKLREIIGRPSGLNGQRPPHVCQWMGISFDEWHRMKDAKARWVINAYPLVDLRLRRDDCLRWFRQHYPGRILAKSACVGCPYHSNREWLRLAHEHPAAMELTIQLDERLRSHQRVQSQATHGTRQYLHRSCRPLREALTQAETLEQMQPALFSESSDFGDECAGHCGV